RGPSLKSGGISSRCRRTRCNHRAKTQLDFLPTTLLKARRMSNTLRALWCASSAVGLASDGHLHAQRDHGGISSKSVRFHLVTGTSLKSSAKALGVSYETVRRQVKSVFHKTGTHRQSELVLTVIRAINEMR